MATQEKVASHRDNFLAERVSSFGGSEAGSCFNIYANKDEKIFKSLFEVIESKKRDYVPMEPNLAMQIGTALESVVIGEYEKQTGNTVLQAEDMFKCKQYPHSHANVDGLIVSTIDGILTVTKVLEIKTTHELWAKGEIPLGYELQVKHYMAILSHLAEVEIDGIVYPVKINGGEIFSLCMSYGNTTQLDKIEFDSIEAKALLNYEESCWQRYLVDGEIPEFGGSDFDKNYILDNFPLHDTEELTEYSDPELTEKVSMYLKSGQKLTSLNKEVKELKTAQDLLKLQILAGVNGCTKSIVGTRIVTFSTGHRKTFAKDILFAEHPEYDSAEYYSNSEFTVMKIK